MLCQLARHNATLKHGKAVNTIPADVTEVTLDTDWVHLDPDRRHDGLRHTAASMFHQNVAFKSTTSYWLDSFGHDRAVYKRNYADVKNPNEVKAYFNILPPETK